MDHITCDNKGLDFKAMDPEGINEPHFWMVIRIGSGGFTKSDATPTRHHKTYEEAQVEALRLAKQHPNHGFAVMKAECIMKGVVQVFQTTWVETKEELRLARSLKNCKPSLDCLTHPMTSREWMGECLKEHIKMITHQNHKLILKAEGIVEFDEATGKWRKTK
jgi:hypothetical protein